ncbi:MAG TPA: extracellular solute-binding protein, partial [Chloroflexota bacterium]|nr:extracellular solute-binding protein [Chloroflexota bacterium]
QWRNKQWAMPFNGILTPYVNLTATEEAGAPRPPATWSDRAWTWDAFLEYGRKLSRQDGGRPVQFGFAGSHGNLRLFMSWVWSNGGELFDKDLTRLTLGEPPALEGLQFQADLINKHRLMPHPSELSSLGGANGLFQNNKVGINVASVGAIATWRGQAGLRWSVTAMPRGAKGAFIGGGGSGWFMLWGGRTEETWELVKVVLSPEGDKLQAMAGEAPPARRSVAHDPEYLTPEAPPGADMKAIVESMETAFRPDPILVQGDEILGIVQSELEQVWSGQRSVPASVEVIKARVEPLLKDERA